MGVSVCLSVEGGSGNIFVNKFLELKYPIVDFRYLEISDYKPCPHPQLSSLVVVSKVLSLTGKGRQGQLL